MTIPGRVLGLDFGTRRVGVAVSDAGRRIAQPHAVLERQRLVEDLPDLVKDLEVVRIVVGLPVSLSGEEGQAAQAARRMAEEVGEATGLPVDLYDERLSTAVAERVLVEGGVGRAARRESVDKVAAAVMLQGYLDRAGTEGPAAGAA